MSGRWGLPDGESAVVGEQTGEEGSRELATVPGSQARGQGNQGLRKWEGACLFANMGPWGAHVP